MKIPSALFLLLAGFPLSTQGQIVLFSFNNALGNEATFAPDAEPADALVSSMSRGSGLTASTTAGAFNAASWTTGSSVDPNDYYAFSIAPSSGYLMSLSGLTLDERRSATGIRDWTVRSSLDNFSANLSLFAVPDDTLTRVDETTSLGVSFQNISSPVEFRIFGYDAEAAAGTWRIDNVELDGQVSFSAVPEPREYTLVAGIGLALFAAVRAVHRRRAERKHSV